MEGLCRMKKRKGWSAWNSGGNCTEVTEMTPAVAAAASVPSSLTSTKALWTTADRTRSFALDMPVSRGKIIYDASLISNTGVLKNQCMSSGLFVFQMQPFGVCSVQLLL